MAYSDKVIEHYNNPRNVGSFAKDEPNVGTGVVGAPECGDMMKLQLKIGDDGVFEDARFKTFGCGSAIASSSYVTELVKGKHIDEAITIKKTLIVKQLIADKGEGAGLRVKVVGGECSGLQYRMEIDAAKERDKVFERDGARLIVDKKSFLYLNGSELDYGEELMSSGFKVVNPNAKRSCGCGESFVV